jgi:methionine sulfoxide reductase heme-binding subunit
MPIWLRRCVIFLFGCLPFGYLLWGAVTQSLGGDPAKIIVLETGIWALRILLLTLMITPFVRYGKWRWLMVHRRMIGLFSLFYATLHLLAYYQFILGGNLTMLANEVIKRPYILIGMPALLILILLGITSTRGWMKRLGKRWQTLHRWVYLGAFLGWLHLAMQIRSSYFNAVIYGLVTLLVLAFRVPDWRNHWIRRSARKV